MSRGRYGLVYQICLPEEPHRSFYLSHHDFPAAPGIGPYQSRHLIHYGTTVNGEVVIDSYQEVYSVFDHDDDQEKPVIGEAALNLAMAGQDINQRTLTEELDLMAGNATNAVRAEKIRKAKRWLNGFSQTDMRDKAGLHLKMKADPDDDGKHH